MITFLSQSALTFSGFCASVALLCDWTKQDNLGSQHVSVALLSVHQLSFLVPLLASTNTPGAPNKTCHFGDAQNQWFNQHSLALTKIVHMLTHFSCFQAPGICIQKRRRCDSYSFQDNCNRFSKILSKTHFLIKLHKLYLGLKNNHHHTKY